jgi:hypothetical protein
MVGCGAAAAWQRLLFELFEFRLGFVCFSSALRRRSPGIDCGLLGALRIPLCICCPGLGVAKTLF